MPFIGRQLLDCAVYLFSTEDAAAAGLQAGGTGFLLSVPSRLPNRFHYYVVTNEHVSMSCPVVRLMRKDGTPDAVPIDDRDWTTLRDGDDPGDDLAVAPLPVDASLYRLYSIHREDLITEEQIDRFKIGPGDDVFMIGRFIKDDGRVRNEPVLRFGNIAMMPDYIRQEDRGYDQLSFMVDMRSISGFSGSAVVTYFATVGSRPGLNASMEVGTEGVVMLASGVINKAWLLGVDWGHLRVKDRGGDWVNSGMAGVVPAWRLSVLLDKLESERQMVDEQWEREAPEGEPLDVAGDSEYERTERLTERLLRVSKEELDEKR
jgi:hypothetical protein